MEADLPITIQTGQSDRIRLTKKFNPYGNNFAVDRIDLKKLVEEVVGLEEITVAGHRHGQRSGRGVRR